MALAGATWRVFLFLDANAPARTRLALADYINGKVPRNQFLALPIFVQSTLNRLFSRSHWSAKCAARSFLLTAAGLFGLCLFSFLYTPKDMIAFFQGVCMLPRTRTLESIFAILLWCFVSDYLNLGKTRIVIAILAKFDLKLRQLALVATVDFLIGVGVFLLGSSFLITLASVVYLSDVGKMPSGANGTPGVGLMMGALVFVLSTVSIGFTGALFYAIPFANLFWSSMLPSLWLWAYVAAALGARLLLSLSYLLPGISRFVDADQNPFKVVGVVAAPTVGLLSLVAVVVHKMAG